MGHDSSSMALKHKTNKQASNALAKLYPCSTHALRRDAKCGANGKVPRSNILSVTVNRTSQSAFSILLKIVFACVFVAHTFLGAARRAKWIFKMERQKEEEKQKRNPQLSLAINFMIIFVNKLDWFYVSMCARRDDEQSTDVATGETNVNSSSARLFHRSRVSCAFDTRTEWTCTEY